MLRKVLFLSMVLAMMISIAINSLAQNAEDALGMHESLGSPLNGIPLAERLNVEMPLIDILFAVGDDLSNWEAIWLEFKSLPEVGICERFDSNAATPTVGELQGYDVVICWANMGHAEPDILGDNLADYVDTGGKVIVPTFCRVNPWHIGGRFLADGYDPFTVVGDTRSWDSVTLGGSNPHPIMEAPYAITTLWSGLRELCDMRADADLVAWWSDDEHLLATKGSVVGMTAYPGKPRGVFWDGHLPELLVNACVWLVGGGVDTGAIIGTVTDADTGDPIVGARIIAINPQTKAKGTTDNNGDYEIPDLEPGRYLVICIARGYKLVIARANVTPGSEIRVDFNPVLK